MLKKLHPTPIDPIYLFDYLNFFGFYLLVHLLIHLLAHHHFHQPPSFSCSHWSSHPHPHAYILNIWGPKLVLEQVRLTKLLCGAKNQLIQNSTLYINGLSANKIIKSCTKGQMKCSSYFLHLKNKTWAHLWYRQSALSRYAQDLPMQCTKQPLMSLSWMNIELLRLSFCKKTCS